MHRSRRNLREALLGALVATLALVTLAVAQGGFDLSWYTVDGGGARSSGGSYTLEGTAGQPDAGAHSGGPFTLAGGFWTSSTAPVVNPPVPSPGPPTAPGAPVVPVAPVAVVAAQPDDDQDDDAERARELREARNRRSHDDVATEGNVLEVHCDAAWPFVVIANRDGAVEVRLTRDAVSACRSIEVGDYLEVDGEKHHEQLYDATEVTIIRNGRRVR